MVYNGLALAGGGMLGIAHVGVIKYLEKQNLLGHIKYFSGSSVGSIISSLLACGVNSKDLKKILFNMDFKSLIGSKFDAIEDLHNIYTKYGLRSGDNIESMFINILDNYVGDSDITFSQVYERYNKILIITTTSWNKRKTIYYSKDKTPSMKISEAVRRSASYPIEFTPEQDDKNLYIDGGILDNYPIKCLEKYLPQDKIFGARFVSDTELTKNIPNPKSLEEYLYGIIRIYEEAIMNSTISHEDLQRTIEINIGTLTSMDFSLTDSQKKNLIYLGFLETEKFFSDN